MPTSNSNQTARLDDLFNNVPAGNRNLIVDGNFDYWINASVAITAAQTTNSGAAMWYGGSAAGGAATIALAGFAGSDVSGMSTPTTYYYTHAQTTASNATGAFPFIAQHIENANTLQGKSATFSCWLWTKTGTVTIPFVGWNAVYGTGGSGNTTAFTKAVNWVVTTTPQKFSVRIDVASQAGSVLGTNNYFNIALYFPSQSTYTINVSQVQLETCSPSAPITGLPTAFEYRGQALELFRIQRYYQAFTVSSIGPIMTYTSNGDTRGFVPFTTPMRGTPIAGINTLTWNAVGFGPSGSVINVAITGILTLATSTGIRIGVSAYANLVPCGAICIWTDSQAFTFTADARL